MGSSPDVTNPFALDGGQQRDSATSVTVSMENSQLNNSQETYEFQIPGELENTGATANAGTGN